MSERNLWEIESELPYDLICGVDEAGRGPLAGPVCAAAVILPKGLVIPGLNDSKKLTDKRRRELFPIIQQEAVSFGVAFASQEEIDEINILQATFSSTATGRRISAFPVRRSSRATASAPTLPRLPFWQKSPGMTG